MSSFQLLMLLVFSPLGQLWSFITATATAKSLQSCSTLCDPVDGSPPGSTVPGILQARTLEWVAIFFSKARKWKVKVKSLSCVQLSVTPWTAAYQAPLTMGFSRQEYWNRVPLPSPKEGWVPKELFFWIVVLEKTLESPLDYKKIKPVNPKGNQPWIFIRMTDAEALILWLPDTKCQLIGKWVFLLLGKTEHQRRRGQQRMKWLVR